MRSSSGACMRRPERRAPSTCCRRAPQASTAYSLSPDRWRSCAGEHPPAYFAIASAPADEELEFLVRLTADPTARAVYGMRPGDRVELVDVVGRGFDLAALEGKDLVFVAMGTGVAPLRSALRATLPRADRYGQIFVLYGARTPEHFCYRDETESWKAAGVELRQVVSRPDGYEWAGQTGYVQSLLDNVLPSLSDPVALVCGSRQMIEQTRDRLREMGFTPEQVLTNY
jgi:NAD(P)H-flavin reductase